MAISEEDLSGLAMAADIQFVAAKLPSLQQLRNSLRNFNSRHRKRFFTWHSGYSKSTSIFYAFDWRFKSLTSSSLLPAIMLR